MATDTRESSRMAKGTAQGVCRFHDGDVYDGEWKDDMYDGTGTFTWADGDVYDGEWLYGAKHGIGKLKWITLGGAEYDGEWMEDQPNGRGKSKNATGNFYEGEVKEGEKHGWGKLTSVSGDVFEGEWVEGLQHGNGTLRCINGDVYEGEWVKGDWAGGMETLAPRFSYSSSDINTRGASSAAPISSCELPGRKMRSQRSQQRRLEADKKACEHCGVDDCQYKLRVCTGCNLALYCSAACQKAASRSHRRICRIISQLPPRDGDRLVLQLDKDTMVDLDAGLRYATKYMANLKHLTLDFKKLEAGDRVKHSHKRLSSMLKSMKGKLHSFCLDATNCVEYGDFDEVLASDGSSGTLQDPLKELHGLKMLRLQFLVSRDIRYIYDIIGQQTKKLEVLSLPSMLMDWRNGSTTIALAISCKKLVKLDLEKSLFFDSDLKVMFQDLPNLRSLNLERHYHYMRCGFPGFTDNTCGLIARQCPNLQHLNLNCHDLISVRGIRTLFEGCQLLRSFHTTTHNLNKDDILSLLDAAPQLLYLSLDTEMEISNEEIGQVIEAVGGRTVFGFTSIGVEDSPVGLSTKTRENYERQMKVFKRITSKKDDPEIANEWADYDDLVRNMS
ncbi:hypothetical protein ACHAXT_011430 [Thalassiosira profunda]